MKVLDFVKKRYPYGDVENEIKERNRDFGFSDFEIGELNQIVLSVVGNGFYWNINGRFKFSVSEYSYADICELADKKFYPVYVVNVIAEDGDQTYGCDITLMPFGCCEVYGEELLYKDEIKKRISTEIKNLMYDRNGEPYKLANNEYYKAERDKRIEEAKLKCEKEEQQAIYDCSYNSYSI